MRCWFWLLFALSVSAVLWGQDSKRAPSGATPPAQSNPSSSQQSQSKSATNPSQPPASGLSNDLTFPEDEPAQPSLPASSPKPTRFTAPRSDRVQVDELGSSIGESSSKDTQVDLTAPPDDAKAHPESSTAVAEAEAEYLSGGVTELRAWDPHKAAKNVEVGDFYFKRKNYRAAEERYREALRYKDNDAVATIRLAVCLEKLGILDDARAEYESYLKIMPHGPQAAEAQKGITRLKAVTAAK
jgi:tetratricopeptide (TPR) repeat protein